MNKIFKILMLITAISGLVKTSSADLMLSESQVNQYANDGYGIYLGTFAGNDNPKDIIDIESQISSSIYYSGGAIDLIFFDKTESTNSEGEDNKMTVSYDPDYKSGTWKTDDPINFYSVKGGKQYSIWWMKDGVDDGLWTTIGLLNNGGNIPEISHLSTFIDQNSGNTSNVPEPNTMVLFGIGILSVFGLLKRRTK